MKKTLGGAALLVLGVWALALAQPAGGATVWWWRQQLILLSGLGSWVLMSLIMVLAVRPAWLERPLGGLDKMYRLHKWAGIGAIGLAMVHYGLDLSKDLLRLFFERPAKPPRGEWWLNPLRDVAKDLGEWSVWLLAAMLLITLWQRFPYHLWRVVHKVLALVYLALALHAVVLAPPLWWQQPVGWLVGVCAAVGAWCAVLSLAGRIGRGRRQTGRVTAVQPRGAGVLEVTCQVPGPWRHRPGQFAFVTFERGEGQHPFTLSNADDGTGTLRFAIKALGDYTGTLAQRVQVGQAVGVEGPYGRFDFRRDRAPEQVWVAAGIGATPFIAWLESLQADPQQAPRVQLHYCVRNAAEAVFAQRLQALCAALPSVTLTIHHSDTTGQVQAHDLLAAAHPAASVWFCGPQGFADALRAAMQRLGRPVGRFHQELFQMR
ncbi:MAG: ferric reductase-like transmembrane domain-containing protein [Simplicispira sp.]|nr:ferric reductase-like transmembrane domain-containing protein [Simplicispira sp.]